MSEQSFDIPKDVKTIQDVINAVAKGAKEKGLNVDETKKSISEYFDKAHLKTTDPVGAIGSVRPDWRFPSTKQVI